MALKNLLQKYSYYMISYILLLPSKVKRAIVVILKIRLYKKWYVNNINPSNNVFTVYLYYVNNVICDTRSKKYISNCRLIAYDCKYAVQQNAGLCYLKAV